MDKQSDSPVRLCVDWAGRPMKTVTPSDREHGMQTVNDDIRARFAVRHAIDLPVLNRRTTRLLEAGVPLSLLIDLSEPSGPHSQAVYVQEGGVTDWIPAPRTAGA